jgi:hypothetical protein
MTLNVPNRRGDVVSQNTSNLMAGVNETLTKVKTAAQSTDVAGLEIVGNQFIRLSEALASGLFTDVGKGLFKEANSRDGYGHIWLKKQFKNPDTGAMEEWLVVYTTDEDETVRQLATAAKQASLQKVAVGEKSEKMPDPKNVPIAQGIKSKDIQMNETGGGGTAKVTVEFTDVDQGLKFYQEGIGEGAPAKEAPKEEQPPAEGADEGEGEGGAQGKGGAPTPAPVAQGVGAPPVPPTPGGMGMAAPASIGLINSLVKESVAPPGWEEPVKEMKKEYGEDSPVPFETAWKLHGEGRKPWRHKKHKNSSIETFTHGGQKIATVLRYLYATPAVTLYSFINESGEECALPLDFNVKVGGQFERPDTGKTIRLGAFQDVQISKVASVVDELFSEAKLVEGKNYYCNTCDMKFSDKQQNFHRGHNTREYGDAASSAASTEAETAGTADTKEATQKTAADVSDQVPPMGWEGKGNAGQPQGAGNAMPPNPALQQDQGTQDASGNAVLYDSQKDDGPQFQTTINPKDKSVTVKFVDSPEEQALNKALTPQAPPAAGGATPPAAAPPAPAAPGGPAQPAQFGQQNVPVEF